MGLWVLEPTSRDKVPGTVYIEREDEQSRIRTAHLKMGTGRHEGVILVPQPSDSPNDPLSKYSKFLSSLRYDTDNVNQIGQSVKRSSTASFSPSAAVSPPEPPSS
jgi:hypothetical protein